MTEYFFRSQMVRLAQAFGEKAYSAPRVELLWKLIADYNQDEFEKFVSRCIIDSKFPPIGPEFREFANEQDDKRSFAKRNEQKRLLAQGKICIYCGNEGFILAIKKTDESRWTFGCNKCDVIKNDPGRLNYGRLEDEGGIKQMRMWDDEFKYEYDLQNIHIWGLETKETINTPEDEENKHFAKEPIHNQNSIFTKQEVREHFQVMKGVLSSVISKEDALNYANCLRTALKDKGIQ